MLKKTIEYEDYNEVLRKEDLYFNLTQTEITELELSHEGGLSKRLEKLVQAQDGATIVAVLKDIILRSYGEKSPDGRRFVKSKELSEAFLQTPAYDILFREIVMNENSADAALEFITGLIPKHLQEKLKQK